MKTNNESPKSAIKGSFGKNEKQSKSMTTVSDKKHEVAKKMKYGFQKDGGWVGKNMVNNSHAKFHYEKK